MLNIKSICPSKQHVIQSQNHLYTCIGYRYSSKHNFIVQVFIQQWNNLLMLRCEGNFFAFTYAENMFLQFFKHVPQFNVNKRCLWNTYAPPSLGDLCEENEWKVQINLKNFPGIPRGKTLLEMLDRNQNQTWPKYNYDKSVYQISFEYQ